MNDICKMTVTKYVVSMLSVGAMFYVIGYSLQKGKKTA